MAYGDIYYSWLKSGSTAASAQGAHLLFGNYEGLSDLNNDDVVHIRLKSVGGNDYNVGPDAANVGEVLGETVYADASGFDLPPMRAGDASRVFFANLVAGTNASAGWSVWKRVP